MNTNQAGLVERVEFRGARRVPADTLRALIYTKPGDPYDVEALHRDFIALWNTNRFDDIRLEADTGDHGGVVLRFVLTERPVIRTLNYEGNKSVSTSEILDRFKERKVGLTVESQYDPAKVQHAAVVLKEYLAERGHQFATVTPELHRIPPNSLEVIFKVDEGPKVKVGEIKPTGNEVFSDLEVIRAMKNLKPIGIPYSIYLENIFSKTYDASKFAEDQERIRQAYTDKGYWFAKVVNGEVVLRDVAGSGRKISNFFLGSKPGKRADLTLTIEEGQAAEAGQDRLRRREAVPHAGRAFPPTVPDAAGRCFLHRETAQGHREHEKAVRRFRLHRFRSGARHRSRQRH